MPIQTERPGGGDDRISVFRARSAEEARKARTALEAAGVPVDLPDQAIDVIFTTNPQAEMPVKVALRHSAKAIQAISAAIPPPEPESPILQAENKHSAADQVLAKVEAAPVARTDKLPPSAVDKNARRAAIIACASIFFPPAGLFAAFMGFAALAEMSSRPDEVFLGKQNAKLGLFLGGLVGFIGTASMALVLAKKHGF